MLGAVLWNVGDEDLEVRDDLELTGGPGPGQVQVRIKATGLCHTELSVMAGILPQVTPLIPGHEAAGEVVAVGEGVSQVKPGDHVIAAWSAPCGRCRFCLGGQAQLCDQIANPLAPVPHVKSGDRDVYSLAGVGSFAEEIILAEQAAVVIPDDVPFEVAAVIGCAVTTGVGAVMNAARVEPGSSVAVFGCGGVGLSVIQGARMCGAAEIVAVDLFEERQRVALQMGATHAVAPDKLNSTTDEVSPGGYDYTFEVVGIPKTIRAAYDAARRGGTVCVVGAGGFSDIVEFNAFELFYMEKKLIGTIYGSADVRTDPQKLVRLWRAGRLDLESLITRRLKLTEINDGLAALRRGEGIRQVVEFA